MLQDQYTIVGKNGKVRNHYEFRITDQVATAGTTGASPLLSSIGGIRLVEEYVSRVLGKRCILMLIQESRFFPMLQLPEEGLFLDLSVSREPDHYRIIAEITGSRNTLLEMTALAEEAGRTEEADSKTFSKKEHSVT